MAGHSVLETARILIRRRRFSDAIVLLESYVHNYKGSFEYYLALGTACLYIGDEGNALKYYQNAREIKINSSELLLGQAAILLRRGETTRALQYYLDILNTDPGNEVALKALEFIRFKGDDYDLICRMKDNGKIEQFYPPLGFNPDIIRNCVLLGLALGLIVSLVIVLWPKEKINWRGDRANLERLELSEKDLPTILSGEGSSASITFNLTEKEALQSYKNAVKYYQKYRNNPAHVEINRILNSNASSKTKTDMNSLLASLEDETFDSLIAHPEDNYTLSQVESTPFLYSGCFVSWTGTIAAPQENADGSWQCRLLVGYEKGAEKMEGDVPVKFIKAPRPALDNAKPVRILGVISFTPEGAVALEGRAYYQPIRGTFSD